MTTHPDDKQWLTVCSSIALFPAPESPVRTILVFADDVCIALSMMFKKLTVASRTTRAAGLISSN